MSNWPNNPVAKLSVRKTGLMGIAQAYDYRGGNLIETIEDNIIKWQIELEVVFAEAKFSWHLSKKPDGDPSLGYEIENPITTGDKVIYSRGQITTDTITIETNLTSQKEFYRLALSAEGTRYTLTPGSNKAFKELELIVIGPDQIMGNIILDYLPISIVYCPPEQDMSSSVIMETSFRTHFCLAESNSIGISSTKSSAFTVGLRNETAGSNSDQTLSDDSSGIMLENYRNTTITADTKSTIGRAYFGPLSDLFVIGKMPTFSGFLDYENNFHYYLESMEKLMVVPAHKLLRPIDDDEIGSIPPFIRRELLKLDPFIKKDKIDLFIPENDEPDISIPLEEAVNKYAYPTENNRSELIGVWYPNSGTDIQYSIKEGFELYRTETNKVTWSTSASESFGFGASLFSILGLEAQNGKTNSFTTSFLSSRETQDGQSKSASCHLNRNQNASDLRGIEIYYDRIFSSLMFRVIPKSPLIINGAIFDEVGIAIDGIPIDLILEKLQYEDDELVCNDDLPKLFKTSTSIDGKFEFKGMPAGIYTLIAGEVKKELNCKLKKNEKQKNIILGKIVAKRIIDFQHSPVWQIRRTLNVSKSIIDKLRRNIDFILDERDIAVLLEVDTKLFKRNYSHCIFKLSKTPIEKSKVIQKKYIRKLRKTGITTLQEAWSILNKKDGIKNISSRIGVEEAEINKWFHNIDKLKASNRVE